MTGWYFSWKYVVVIGRERGEEEMEEDREREAKQHCTSFRKSDIGQAKRRKRKRLSNEQLLKSPFIESEEMSCSQ